MNMSMGRIIVHAVIMFPVLVIGDQGDAEQHHNRVQIETVQSDCIAGEAVAHGDTRYNGGVIIDFSSLVATHGTVALAEEQLYKIPYLMLYFYGDYCTYCKKIEPHVRSIAQRYADRLTVVRINSSAYGSLSLKYSIKGVPTLVLLTKGVVVEKSVGNKPEDALNAIVSKVLLVSLVE